MSALNMHLCRFASFIRRMVIGRLPILLAMQGVLAPIVRAQPTPVFTDWTSVTSNRAIGMLGDAAVTLASSRESPFSGTVVNGTSDLFNSPLFTPQLALSDALFFQAAPTPVTYTISFSEPVVNPILHLQSLASTLTFAGVSPVKLSGQDGLQASGNTIIGSYPGLMPLPYNDANGSVLLPGTFSSLSFTATWPGGIDGIGLQLGQSTSIPVVWSNSYDPGLGSVPQVQGWTLMQSGPPSPQPQVDGGALALGPTVPGSIQVFTRNDIATRFVSGTLIVEFDLQILDSAATSNGSVWYTGYWFYLVDADGRQMLVGFTNDGVYAGNNNEPGASAFVSWNTTSAPSRYRLFINSNGISLWANNTLLIDNYPLGSTSNTRLPRLVVRCAHRFAM